MQFSSLNLPSTDLAQSRTFVLDVLGATLTSEGPHAVHARLGDFDLTVSEQNGGGALPSAEYPHCALTVTPEQFVGLKRRVEAFGIPHNEPWSRPNRAYALMYFRDPTSNQFELFAPTGAGDTPLRMGAKAGGDYTTDFLALNYARLSPPASHAASPLVPPTGFNHLTVPCRELHEGKRFLVDVLGGVVNYEAKTHVTTTLGGVDIGCAPQSGGWTAPENKYPHYGFTVGAADLLALRDRLVECAIPVHPIAVDTDGSAVLYFRDPSGNLWKLVCPQPSAGVLTPTSPKESEVDVRVLNYDRWNDPGKLARA